MNLEREEKLFEEWCEIFGLSTEQVDEEYTDSRTALAWLAWYEVLNRKGYKFVPVEPKEEQWSGLARHLSRYMQMHDRYCPKTLKKYLDRFHRNIPEWLNKEVGNWESDHAFATADLPVFIYKAMLGAVDD